MKSSALGRSNLSKEKIAVLEALSEYKEDSSFDESPEVYVRPENEEELDLLWNNFKINQKFIKSPGVYLAVGFVAGAIFMLLLTTIVSFSSKTDNKVTPKQSQTKTETIDSVSDTTTSTDMSSTRTYTVQNGDTVESIIIKTYGSYSPEKADLIQSVNNMSDIDKLQIGQKLIIPMD